MFKWDQQRTNENEQYLKSMNENEWYLKYTNKNVCYCNIHFFDHFDSI